jgi:glycogen operon protein
MAFIDDINREPVLHTWHYKIDNAACPIGTLFWKHHTSREARGHLPLCSRALALRMNRDLPVERLDMTLNELLRLQPPQWHGVRLNAPDWSSESHTLAATVSLLGYPLLLHIIINAYWEPLEFEIPVLDPPQESWRRCIDTYLDPPDDICSWANARALQGSTCRVEPRSLVLLLAKTGDRP